MKQLLVGALASIALLATASPAIAVSEPTTAATTPSTAGAAEKRASATGISNGKPVKDLEGVIRLLAADTTPDAKGRSHDTYTQVLVAGDKSYVLKGAKKGKPNTRVRVSGLTNDTKLEADSMEVLSAAMAAPATTGTTRVLVMLAH